MLDDPGAVPSSAGDAGGREAVRARVVEAAADLLAQQGREAVTTRSVAAAAGVQVTAIYRHFGDMDGLLEAVAAHGYAVFLRAKRDVARPADPVDDLRGGFDLAVEFGLTHPALYALMYGEPRRGTSSAAFAAGMEVLRARIDRLAAHGQLRVDARLAASLIHAATRGAVLTWLSQPPDQRHPGLLPALREALVAAVTTAEPALRAPGPAAAARALRATLPQDARLSAGEQHLLTEWLDRLAEDD